MRNRLWLICIAAAAVSAALDGQTVVDIGRQGKLRSGTTLPATCAVGQVFLRALDSGGGRLYSCSAANTWTPVGAAGLTENGDGSVSAAGGFSERRCAVAASGAPAFDASACNVFTLTLGTNADSSTLTGAKDGQELTFVISQDEAGGKGFTWPAEFEETCTVGSQPFETTVAKAVYYGGAALTTSCTTSEPATLMSGPTRQPPADPPSGLACWFDANGDIWKCKDAAGKVSSSVVTSAGAVPNEFVTHVDGNGVVHTAPISVAQLSEGAIGTGAVARVVAPRLDGATLMGQTTAEGVSLGGDGCVSRTWPAGAGGVAAGTLVAVSAGTVAPHTAGAAIYGIAKTGGSAGAAVEVCIVGTANLKMENGATADHIAVASSTAPGSGRDSGVTAAESVAPGSKVAGKIVSGCAGAGCMAAVNIETAGGASAGGATDLANLTTAGMLQGNLGIGSNAIVQQYANDPSTGTVEKRLVTLSGSNKQVRSAGTSRTGVIGVCVNSNGAVCGQSGAAAVIIRGRGTCAFDNATAEGNYVQANGIDGRCHDAGAAYPTSGGTVIGQSLETGAAGDHEIRVGAESQATAAGGGGGGTLSGTYSGRPVCDSGISGALYFSSDSVALSRCTGAGTWEEYVGGVKRSAPPAASTFTMVNQGGSSLSDANGGLLFADPATAGDSLRLACRSAYPSTPYTWTIGVQAAYAPVNYSFMGIALYDGTKAVTYALGIFGDLSPTGLGIEVNNWSSLSANVASLQKGYFAPAGGGLVYLSVTDDGSNLNFYLSSNPFDVTRSLFRQVSRTAYLPAGPSKLCLVTNTSNTTTPVSMLVLDWRLQ